MNVKFESEKECINEAIDKKSLEIALKFPRTRISDCSRLVFFPETDKRKDGWIDIDSGDYLQPQFSLPPLVRNSYTIYFGFPSDSTYSFELVIVDGMTINDVVRKVCEAYHEIFTNDESELLRNLFLWGVFLKKDGTGYIEIEVL